MHAASAPDQIVLVPNLGQAHAHFLASGCLYPSALERQGSMNPEGVTMQVRAA